MPVKKSAKKTTKAKPKKIKKARPKKKTVAKGKKGDVYQCAVCGYRLIVDETCGCAEEHIFVCCNKVMRKKRGKKAA